MAQTLPAGEGVIYRHSVEALHMLGAPKHEVTFTSLPNGHVQFDAKWF
jgi:hypothetical protein